MNNYKKLGLIYIATSITSKKSYVGQTTAELQIRKREHCLNAFCKNSKSYNTHFYRAIRKYGKDDFIWNILQDKIPRGQLDTLEVDCIKVYDSFSNGYNSTTGGIKNFTVSHEVREKISKAKTNKTLSAEHVAKIVKANTGQKRSAEIRAKMSKSRTGIALSDNHRKNLSTAHTGKILSNEHKKNLLKAAQKRTGENSPVAKLTWKIVREIRVKYKTKKYSSRTLAKEYNIGKSTVLQIINNKTWKK